MSKQLQESPKFGVGSHTPTQTVIDFQPEFKVQWHSQSACTLDEHTDDNGNENENDQDDENDNDNDNDTDHTDDTDHDRDENREHIQNESNLKLNIAAMATMSASNIVFERIDELEIASVDTLDFAQNDNYYDMYDADDHTSAEGDDADDANDANDANNGDGVGNNVDHAVDRTNYKRNPVTGVEPNANVNVNENKNENEKETDKKANQDLSNVLETVDTNVQARFNIVIVNGSGTTTKSINNSTTNVLRVVVV